MAALSACVFGSLVFFFSVCSAKEMSTIIIGAGMSGVMAAKTLAGNGVKDFLILEATNRMGGRMHRTSIGNYTIELGANWVEGVGGAHVNPIWTLANKYKLRNFISDWSNISSNIYRQSGGLHPQSETARPYKMATLASDFASELSESLKRKHLEDISILSAQRVHGYVPQTPLEMAVDFFFYDFEIAEPPRVTSLKNVEPIHTFEYYGEDEYFVADSRGYEHIVHSLAKEFLNLSKNGWITDNRLQLNKVVRKIIYSDKAVKVITEDGSVYTAKTAIVSVSLGVLQSNLIAFEPRLPMAKRLAIAKFDMTDYCKIFMKFPSRFWPVGPGTEFFMYAHEQRGYYNFWQHLENEYPGGNLLMVTLTDEESKRVENQPENETRAEIMEVLRSMFGEHVPEMEAIVIPKWGKDRFFRGTYSNWPIGATVKDFEALKAPVGPVYFTGEHTSQEENGYVHGAYLEGISCANKVLECLNKGLCSNNATSTATSHTWETQKATTNEERQKPTSSNRSRRKAQKMH
eukprot:TRINITY_DN8314_c0_g1_i1.p1 TRINITY_DN8314_c0_g1~~TRINITY_DN8314_c0_g1_i1.p1  ORF type:complete len:528 (-),score=50.91 TRINITY_DN8314_c0_g1_i1:115-1668(-)